MKKAFFVSLIAASVVFVACDKETETTKYATPTLPMTSANVATPAGVTIPPSPGSGTFQANYDASSRTLSYTITWEDLSAAPIAIHIHGNADPGLIALPAPLGPFTIDSFRVSATQHVRYAGGIAQKITVPSGAGTSGSVSGTLVIDNLRIREADLLAEQFYVDIHTTGNPLYIALGEIRAQVDFE